MIFTFSYFSLHNQIKSNKIEHLIHTGMETATLVTFEF